MEGFDLHHPSENKSEPSNLKLFLKGLEFVPVAAQ